jgi:LAS superfamily LD-carboxypeptidase LdcB
MKLVPTNDALTIISVGLSAVEQTTRGLKKAVKRRLDQDKRQIQAAKMQSFKLADAEKKADAEKLMEAKKPVSNIGASAGKQMSKGGGFFSRLIKALGFLVAGYVIDKLPQIIEEVQRIIYTVQRVFGAITNIWNTATTILREILDVGKQLWENITNLDFFDSEGKLKRELDQAGQAINQGRVDWELETTNITKAIQDWVNGKGVEDIKAALDGNAAPSQTSASSATSSTSGSLQPIHKQAAEIIKARESKTSGEYNAMNQGTVKDPTGADPRSGASKGIIGKDLTSMTIGEVIAQQNKKLNNDQGYIFAAGAYQFIPGTLESAMRLAGLTPSDKFSPENQDLMFVALLQDGGLGHWQADPRHTPYTDAEKLVIEQARKTPLKTVTITTPQPPTTTTTPQPLTPKAGSGDVNLVDTGYRDYKGRPIRLNKTGPKGNVAAAFKEMAAAAAKDGIDIGQGISSAYRSPSENAATSGSDKNSSHMYGEAFDINWNSAAGKWIRKNAHKYGFQHADYSATSTHFNYTGKKTQQQPPSTLMSSSPTSTQSGDIASSLYNWDEEPIMVPFPINKGGDVAKSDGGSKKKSEPDTIGDYSPDLLASLRLFNNSYT